MKKLLALLLALVMVLSFAACNKAETPVEEPVEEPTEEPVETATASYKLGMGVVVSTGSATDGNAQVDATVAAVVVDADGKIVAAKLDAAQTKLNTAEFPEDLTTVDVRSKYTKGTDYNMKAFRPDAVGEWYEQADFFCNYIIGKTGAEVAALELTTRESDGYTVAADADLYAGCSIQIGEFMTAVSKACADEYAKEFTADSFKLGLAVSTDVTGSTAATADAAGVAQLYSDFAAVVTDANGAILADLVDAIQPKIAFDTTGALGDITFAGTKKELKEGYNMKAFRPDAIGEWYEQATFFENFVVGMTGADVAGLELTTREADGYTVAADADLYAGCSIQIGTFMENVSEAAK